MKKLIVVSDWANDLLSCQEFRSSVEGYLNIDQTVNINFVASTSSTIHTSFLSLQVVETEERLGHPNETVLFINTDPRLPKPDGSINNQGGNLLITKLKTGIYAAGPNAGFCYSLVKSKIDQLFKYDIAASGDQFRSRDLYARILSLIMRYREAEFELEEVSLSLIPQLEGYYIGHIDNFGNIKTTINTDQLKGKYVFNDEILFNINNVKKKAMFVKGLFAGSPGQLIVYPGSSGPVFNPYLEIGLWSYFDSYNSKTGVFSFNNPRPGDGVHFE